MTEEIATQVLDQALAQQAWRVVTGWPRTWVALRLALVKHRPKYDALRVELFPRLSGELREGIRIDPKPVETAYQFEEITPRGTVRLGLRTRDGCVFELGCRNEADLVDAARGIRDDRACEMNLLLSAGQ